MLTKRATSKMWGRRVRSVGETFLWAIMTLLCIPIAIWKSLKTRQMHIILVLMSCAVILFFVGLISVAQWAARNPSKPDTQNELHFQDRPITKADIDETLAEVSDDSDAKSCVILISSKNIKEKNSMQLTELMELKRICVQLSKEDRMRAEEKARAKELLDYVNSKK